MADKAFLDRLARELTDQGKLIEAGWIGLRIAAISPEVPQAQLEEMRQIFFAGASHLYSSMMQILEPNPEPTEKDMKRMELIHNELKKFLDDFKLKHVKTEGNS